MPKSAYYRPTLHEYELVSGSVKRLFVLTDAQYNKLLKPGAVHIADGATWHLSWEEKATHEMLTVRTDTHCVHVNRR